MARKSRRIARKRPVKHGKKRRLRRGSPRAKAKKSVGKCFVLMPFKEPFNGYYTTIIKPAVVSAGLDALRGDSLFRPAPIMGDIWKMIQDAKVLIAELTEQNGNVFYELGLAHAVGKPVVLIAEKMDDVPFDLRPLRVITYNKDNPEWGNQLRGEMVSSIKETLGDPASAVPTMFRKREKRLPKTQTEAADRLATLERQVAALHAGQGSVPSSEGLTPIRDSVQFSSRLREEKTVSGAIQLVRRAIDGGLPDVYVHGIVAKHMGEKVADFVMSRVRR